MANSFDDSPDRQFGPYPLPDATTTAARMHEIIAQVRHQAEKDAEAKYAAALKNHVDNLKRAPLIDELKDLVSYGDIVIRKVGNGYVIRRIPGSYMNPAQGSMIETWVVEGNDIKGVADQLTAIQADDAMKNQSHDALAAMGQNAATATGARMMIDGAPDRVNNALSRALVDRIKIGPMVKFPRFE